MKIHTIPFHIGDYQTDTLGLDDAEHGAYLMITFALYSDGGAIEIEIEDDPEDKNAPRGFTFSYGKNERLRRIACTPTRAQWKKRMPVVLPFFEVIPLHEKPGFAILTKSKIMQVLQEIEQKSEKNKQNISRRWAKKDNKNNGASIRPNYDGNTNQSQSHIKNKKSEIFGVPETGTTKHKLFEIIKSLHGHEAWAAWFHDKTEIDGHQIYCLNNFTKDQIETRFSKALHIGGFFIAGTLKQRMTE